MSDLGYCQMCAGTGLPPAEWKAWSKVDQDAPGSRSGSGQELTKVNIIAALKAELAQSLEWRVDTRRHLVLLLHTVEDAKDGTGKPPANLAQWLRDSIGLLGLGRIS